MGKFEEIHKKALMDDMKKTTKTKILFYLFFGIFAIIIGLFINRTNIGQGLILVMGGILVGANIEKLVTYSFRQEISKGKKV